MYLKNKNNGIFFVFLLCFFVILFGNDNQKVSYLECSENECLRDMNDEILHWLTTLKLNDVLYAWKLFGEYNVNTLDRLCELKKYQMDDIILQMNSLLDRVSIRHGIKKLNHVCHHIRYQNMNKNHLTFNMKHIGYGVLHIQLNNIITHTLKILYKKDDNLSWNITIINMPELSDMDHITLDLKDNTGIYYIKLAFNDGINWSQYSDTKIVYIDHTLTEWEQNIEWKSKRISLTEGNIIQNTMDFYYRSIFLTNEIYVGTYEYIFRIIYVHDYSWDIKFGIYQSRNGGNVCEGAFPKYRWKQSYYFFDHGGPRIRPNDIIKLIINMDTLEFTFYINDVRHGKILKIKKDKYKVGVVLFDMEHSLQFLRCNRVD